MLFLILNRENNNMLIIEQLRQDIANKETELSNCSRSLKELTTQRANQQRLVTKKENEIDKLKLELVRLQRELIGAQQELANRENVRANCSSRETELIFEVGRLKMNLRTLESNETVDSNVGKSSYRRFGAN